MTEVVMKVGARTTKVLGMALSILMVLGTVFVMSEQPASADASGCTTSDYGFVCLDIYGRSEYVSGVAVYRTKFNYSNICNWEGWVTAYYPTGGSRLLAYGSKAGCSPGWAYTYRSLGWQFPSGTKICGAWREDGRFMGQACNWIRR